MGTVERAFPALRVDIGGREGEERRGVGEGERVGRLKKKRFLLTREGAFPRSRREQEIERESKEGFPW